jgi:hypothetical protein
MILCTLTLHHFKDEEIIKIMTSFYANASMVLLLMICSEVHSLIDCFSVVFRFSIKQYVKARWLNFDIKRI